MISDRFHPTWTGGGLEKLNLAHRQAAPPVRWTPIAALILSLACGPTGPAVPSAPGPTAEAAPSEPAAAAAGGLLALALAIYTDSGGEQAAQASEPEALRARLRAGCLEPVCREALALLDEPGALQVLLAETRDLPAPEFIFAAGDLAAADRERLPKLARVVMMDVVGPAERPLLTIAAAHLVARAIGREVKGLVFDPETLKLWQPDELPIPEPTEPALAEDHLGIGVLALGDGYRVATFGMAKMLGPDVVAEGVPQERVSLGMALVGAVALRLRSEPDATTLELTADEVARAVQHGTHVPEAVEGAAGRTVVALAGAARRTSDPDNQLRAIVPATGEEQARLYGRIAEELFGHRPE